MKLPPKTVECLSQYRRILHNYKHLEESYIFSHDLAKLLKINPVQVRRDFMLIGFSGSSRNGYRVDDLLEFIDSILTSPKGQKATIIGMGELGKALLKHISSNPVCPVTIPATFDIDPKKTNKVYYGIDCYDLTKAPELFNKYNIQIAILAIATNDIQEIVDSLLISGIKSIINVSGGPFRMPENIYLKDFDIRTTQGDIIFHQLGISKISHIKNFILFCIGQLYIFIFLLILHIYILENIQRIIELKLNRRPDDKNSILKHKMSALW